ncbi:hypothetical protein HY025_01495 [Candidatus Daviesbacteria bacterium]|nr:hypothetical protein [Candidatus Daviesbacteria bacterium]
MRVKNSYKKFRLFNLPALGISIFLLILVLFSLGFAQTANASSGSATLAVYPYGGTLNKGCSYLLNVGLNTGGLDTDGTDVVLFYDPTVLSILAIIDTRMYPNYVLNSIDNINGKISISALASASQPIHGKNILAQINFTVLPQTTATTTTINFDFDPSNPTKTTDSNVTQTATILDILKTVYNGSYKVGSGSC